MNLSVPICVAVVALSGACASLEPLVPSTMGVVAPSSHGIDLDALEGREDRLVLRAAVGTGEFDQIELYRVVGDGEPELLEKIAVDAERRALFERGVELVERGMVSGQRYAYQALLLLEDQVVGESAIVDITWAQPPHAPREVRVDARFPDAVELHWRGGPEEGAVIFRRDVLTDGPFVRVGELAPSFGPTWVDRDVRPGGVWSYRVALSRRTGGVIQYGPLSEAVYASTPEEDP